MRRTHIWLTLGVTLGALAVATIGMVSMTHIEREHLVYTRFVRVEDLALVTPSYPANSEADRFAERFRGDDPIEIMHLVRDSVDHTEAEPATENPAELLTAVDNGSGLVCSGMASIYRAALEANGYEARIVVAARFLTDPYDSHATVEVRQGDRWVIYDPTFGITFERAGYRLGAQELKEALLTDGMKGIVPVEHDLSAAYPARIDEYYTDWHVLFSNVIVRQPAPTSMAKLPIIRWWSGEKRFYEVVDGHSGQNVEFLGELGLLAAVVLPVGVLILLFIALGLSAHLFVTRPRADA